MSASLYVMFYKISRSSEKTEHEKNPRFIVRIDNLQRD